MFATIGAIVLTGDKVVRPILVSSSTRLGFVWVLMGNLGGLQLLGLIGIFVGPVVLTLASALWSKRATRFDRDQTTQVATATMSAESQQILETHRPIANSASCPPPAT